MANQPTGPLTSNRYPNTRPSAFESGAALPHPNAAEAHKIDAEGNRLGAPVPNPNATTPKSVPPEPSPVAELTLRYPSHFSAEQLAAARRELNPEVTCPPGIDPNHPDLAVFKRAARTAGLDNATATRFLSEWKRAVDESTKK